MLIRILAALPIPPLLLGPASTELNCTRDESGECSTSATEPAESECVPDCRSGFDCVDGACVEQTSAEQTSAAAQCVPACREGYVCHDGGCISACNPACPEGQQCTSDGECVAATASEGSKVTVLDNSCGAGCPHPYVCQQGECRITESYLEGLEREGNSRVKGGIWTMGIGAGIAAVGLIVGGVAIAQQRRWGNEADEIGSRMDCEITPSCAAERDAAHDRRNKWENATGPLLYVVGPVGLVVLIAGGITYGVGKSKLARSKEFRGKPVVWMGPDGAGGGFTLEF